jgi:hypothetical protein
LESISANLSGLIMELLLWGESDEATCVSSFDADR